ncbi:MAG TPA: AAA family ATPase [Phycisphaerae bacterium]|nr:AAA family ATPase [Phycisphaerae bacterium]
MIDNPNAGGRSESPARELLSEQGERALVAATIIPQAGVLTEEQRGKVRAAAKTYREKHKLKNADIARGIGEGSPSLWSAVMGESYPKQCEGKLDDHLRTLNDWLEEDARRRATRPGRPFVYTTIANTMIDAAKLTQRYRWVTVVFGPTGIGKTMVAHVIAETHVGAIYLCLARGCCTYSQIRDRLHGLVCRGGQSARQTARRESVDDRIFAKLRDSGRLIVVDEAHRVRDSGLEFLRDVHDQTGCPVLLICTKDLWERILSDDEDHGQMRRRVGMAMDLAEGYRDTDSPRRKLFTAEQIRKLYETPHVRLTTDAIEYLADVANCFGQGSLGTCDNLVDCAIARARKRDGVGPEGRVVIDALLLAEWGRKMMREHIVAPQVEERRRRFVANAG